MAKDPFAKMPLGNGPRGSRLRKWDICLARGGESGWSSTLSRCRCFPPSLLPRLSTSWDSITGILYEDFGSCHGEETIACSLWYKIGKRGWFYDSRAISRIFEP